MENQSTEIVPTETVGDITCCVWREATNAPPIKQSDFGWRFYVVIVLVVGAIFAVAKAILWAIANGNFALANGLMIGMAVSLYAGGFIAAYVNRRKRIGNDPHVLPPPPPPGVPRGAAPVIVVVRRSDAGRGRSFGWLWVEGPWLRFQGDRFDFRLQPDDFRTKKNLKWLLRREFYSYLQAPKKHPAVMLAIFPGFYVEARRYKAKELTEGMASQIELWAEGAGSRSPSLYPPLSLAPVEPGDLYPARKWVPVAALFGLVCASVVLFAPSPNGDHVSPIGIFLAGFAYFGAVFLMPWIAQRSRQRQAKKAEDAASKTG